MKYDDDGGFARSIGWEAPPCKFKVGDVVYSRKANRLYMVTGIVSGEVVRVHSLNGFGKSTKTVKRLRHTPLIAQRRKVQG